MMTNNTHRWETARWKVPALVLFALTMLALWRWTPAAEYIHPERIRLAGDLLAVHPYGPLMVVGIFLIAGVLMFPLTVLILGTAMAFEPAQAISYALLGSVGCAVTGYGIGRFAGGNQVRALTGTRMDGLHSWLKLRGSFSIAALRMVPMAPFTPLNIVAGALPIRFRHYLLGTVLGMTPGIVVLALLGNQLGGLLAAPKPAHFAWMGALLLSAGGLIWIVRRFLPVRQEVPDT
jgi:phospholipase D1/2